MGIRHAIFFCKNPLAFVVAGVLLCYPAVAAPTLTVSSLGANLSGNLEWLVEVSPDVGLFTNTNLGLGGSLAVELAFEVSGADLLGATVNGTDWPLNTEGNNPFTHSTSTGIALDLPSDTLFASLLSNFFSAGTAVEVLTIETAGTDCTTLAWGGHTLLGGTADEYASSLLAQAGQNFSGYEGRLAVPDVDGDFEADCDVDGGDFLVWQRHFGSPYTAMDLSDWKMNFGTPAPLQATTTEVPEPSGILLLLTFLLASQSRLHSFPFWDFSRSKLD